MTATVGVGTRPPLWWTLIRHELRLTFRDFGQGSAKRRASKSNAKARKPRPLGWLILGGVIAFVVLHAAGAMSLVMPHRWVDTQWSRVAATVFAGFVFTLMLSMAMTRVVSAFHERRDLDLLLSAPIAPSLVLTIRALAIVAAISVLFAIFLFPIADVGVASRRWWMARLYVFVPLMAALATGIALVLTGTLVRVIGVRRARVGLQIFSAMVGASFFLVSQAQQMLPKDLSARATRWLLDAARIDDPLPPFVVMSRLAGGDGPTWLLFVTVAVGLFAGAVWLVRHRFLEVAQRPEAESRVATASHAAVARRFARGFAQGAFTTLLRKEWRLILRAPQLLSQVLLQLLYLMPLMLTAFGRRGWGATWTDAAFAAGIVGITGTLATSLAWLAVSAEDAPDLLAGSPKGQAMVLSAKLCAAAAPPIAIVVLAAVGMTHRSTTESLVVLVYGSLACISAAIMEAAAPSPGKRNDFQRRHKGRGFWPLVEALQFLLWGGAAGAAASGHWIVAAVLTVLALVMPAFRLPRALAQLRPAES